MTTKPWPPINAKHIIDNIEQSASYFVVVGDQIWRKVDEPVLSLHINKSFSGDSATFSLLESAKALAHKNFAFSLPDYEAMKDYARLVFSEDVFLNYILHDVSDVHVFVPEAFKFSTEVRMARNLSLQGRRPVQG